MKVVFFFLSDFLHNRVHTMNKKMRFPMRIFSSTCQNDLVRGAMWKYVGKCCAMWLNEEEWV